MLLDLFRVSLVSDVVLDDDPCGLSPDSSTWERRRFRLVSILVAVVVGSLSLLCSSNNNAGSSSLDDDELRSRWTVVGFIDEVSVMVSLSLLCWPFNCLAREVDDDKDEWEDGW